MIARLQRHKKRTAPCPLAGFLQGDNFCVWHSGHLVKPAADNLTG
jgi:hypothetical protein